MVFCLACFAPFARAAPNAPEKAEPGDKPRVLIAPLRRSGLNSLWLAATIENVKGSIIIDTGSPLTALSDAKYRFLLRGDAHKLPPGNPASITLNTLNVPIAVARDFRLGGQDLGAALVALVPERYLDEGEVFHYGDRASDFDGLMGEDFLQRYRAVIDCHRQLLYLNLGPAGKQNLADVLVPNGWTRIPMTDVGTHPVVPCTLGGYACRLIVDTGSPFTTVDERLARAIKIGSETLPLSGGLIGNDSRPQSLVHLHTLRIGDYTADDVQMTAMANLSIELVSGQEQKAPVPIVGLLGADTLGFNGAIIDLGGHNLYLKHLPNGARKP